MIQKGVRITNSIHNENISIILIIITIKTINFEKLEKTDTDSVHAVNAEFGIIKYRV